MLEVFTLGWLKRKRNPEIFQGDMNQRRYFEGWYFKNVDPREARPIAIIPGISLTETGSHAFIQVLEGNTGISHYMEYPLKEFWASKEEFDIKVGECRFTWKGINLNIEDERVYVEGSISFNDPVTWRRSLLTPGIMGWYSYVPFMECYHGLVSMSHSLSGSLAINGDRVDYTEGKGYAEKDWGRSFPSAHIWMQSNHFDNPETSFMLSAARIPWVGSSFTGFILILWYKGEFLNMSTYTGARLIRLRKEEDRVHITVEKGRHSLDVTAYRGSSGLLRAPKLGEMQGRVSESMDSLINIRLVNNVSKDILYEDSGRNSGLEIRDELDELLEGLR